MQKRQAVATWLRLPSTYQFLVGHALACQRPPAGAFFHSFASRSTLRSHACYALASILIWRGLAASFLGSETLSTPFLNDAAIFSVSKLLGTAKLRVKLP